MDKKTIIISIITFVILAAVVMYYKKNSVTQPSTETQQPVSQNEKAIESTSVGSSIYKSINTENPTSKMPKANPFEAPTNPISNSYENPFN